MVELRIRNSSLTNSSNNNNNNSASSRNGNNYNNSDDEQIMIPTGLSRTGNKGEEVSPSPTSIVDSTIYSENDLEHPRQQHPRQQQQQQQQWTEFENQNDASSTNIIFPRSIVRYTTRRTVVEECESNSSNDETIEQLMNTLRGLECDLSGEKAIRRKKEKSIVKLAKQLQITSRDAEVKDRQVLKMAKTINDLEEILHDHHRELADDQEKIRKVCRETEERLEEYEAMVFTLRKQLAEANLEVDMLNSRIQMEGRLSLESPIYRSIANDKSTNDSDHWQKVKNRIAAASVAIIAVAVTAGLSCHSCN
jgi:hypothetical protein